MISWDGYLAESNAPWIEKLLRGDWYRGARKSGGSASGTGLGLWGVGLYLTWSTGIAQFFADRSGGEVLQYKVKPGVKILDGQSKVMVDIKKELGVGPYDKIDDPMFARMLTLLTKEAGYDGIVNDNPADGLVLFDAKHATLVKA